MPNLNFNTSCTNCSLSTGKAVGGVGPSDLSRVKLIVISDHPNSQDEKDLTPFSPASRMPPHYSQSRIIKWHNSGGFIRSELHRLFKLESEDCYFTYAVKCNPRNSKANAKHFKQCSATWLTQELSLLNQFSSHCPILVAGREALQTIQFARPSLAKLGSSIRTLRRSSSYFLDDHPLVFTINPLLAASSVPRFENHIVGISVNSIKELPYLPGSPNQIFVDDLLVLKSFLH